MPRLPDLSVGKQVLLGSHRQAHEQKEEGAPGTCDHDFALYLLVPRFEEHVYVPDHLASPNFVVGYSGAVILPSKNNEC